MLLAVVPHNTCWPSRKSPSGYATRGGIVLQIGSISELFNATRVIMPRSSSAQHAGEMPVAGHNLSVVPLRPLPGSARWRRLGLPLWLLDNGPRIVAEMASADAVFAVVPGEIGSLVLVLASILRKPLLVRYIINWYEPRTFVDRFERRLLERIAGGKNVILVTGESEEPPSRNLNIRWIFSTTLSQEELAAATPHVLRNTAALRLIIVARQEFSKGTDLLIRSLLLLMEDLPGIKLDVVGDGSALPKFCELLPTTGESFGKSVIEALGCGLPVITTRVSVFPKLIGARCGVIIDQRTPEHLAAAIRHCLTDPERYRRMSSEAIAVARSYSLEKWRDTVRAMLDEAWGPSATRKQ
jgi:glycosyltransferase involved in cell wall biosynthesis